jgi:hypothetical protein
LLFSCILRVKTYGSNQSFYFRRYTFCFRACC